LQNEFASSANEAIRHYRLKYPTVWALFAKDLWQPQLNSDEEHCGNAILPTEYGS